MNMGDVVVAVPVVYDETGPCRVYCCDSFLPYLLSGGNCDGLVGSKELNWLGE